MKWIRNNVTTELGNHRCLLAKFDTSDYWFCYDINAWTGRQIIAFRKAASLLGASTIEIKYQYDENDKLSEPEENIVTIVNYVSEEGLEITKFRIELDVQEGQKRKFKYFTIDELKQCRDTENFHGVAFEECTQGILRFFCGKYGEYFKYVCAEIEEFNRKYKNMKLVVRPEHKNFSAFINVLFTQENEEKNLFLYDSSLANSYWRFREVLRGFELAITAVNIYGLSAIKTLPKKDL